MLQRPCWGHTVNNPKLPRVAVGLDCLRRHTPDARPKASSSTVSTGHPSPDQLPLPTGEWKANIPVIGETPEFLQNPQTFVLQRKTKYGSPFRTHLFGKPMYVLADWDSLNKTMHAEHDLVEVDYPESLEALIGSLDIMKDAERHKTMRRQLSAAFAADAMASYVPAVEAVVRKHLSSWAKQDKVELYAVVKDITFDFANSLLIGLDLPEREAAAIQANLTALNSGFISLPIDFPGTTFTKAKKARSELLKLLKKYVTLLRTMMKPGHEDTGSKKLLHYVITTQIAEGEAVKDARLVLFIAASDTTTTSLSALLGFLPQLSPHIMDKLREEQQDVIASHGPELTRDSLNAMKYANAVVREALRLFGPSRGLGRKALRDFEVGGKRIPRGSNLWMSVDGAHASDPCLKGSSPDAVMRSLSWQNPEASFVPERWLQEGGPKGIATFGVGGHLCLGMPLYVTEARAVLAVLAREYDLERLTPEVQWITFPSPRPAHDVFMRLTKRRA